MKKENISYLFSLEKLKIRLCYYKFSVLNLKNIISFILIAKITNRKMYNKINFKTVQKCSLAFLVLIIYQTKQFFKNKTHSSFHPNQT